MPENKYFINLDGWDLHRAAMENRTDITQALLLRAHHISLGNARDEHDTTPLHMAARENSLEVATLLLEHGADVNLRDEHDTTPLHVAARENSLEVASVLLEHGADVPFRVPLAN